MRKQIRFTAEDCIDSAEIYLEIEVHESRLITLEMGEVDAEEPSIQFCLALSTDDAKEILEELQAAIGSIDDLRDIKATFPE